MMNTKISGIFVSLLFLLTIFINSCSSNSDLTNDSASQSTYINNTSSKKQNSDFRSYAIKIGQLHNDYLRKAFSGFNYQASDFNKETLYQFSQIDKDLYEKNYDYFVNYKGAEDQEIMVLKYLETEVGKNTLDKFNTELTNAKNLKQFVSNIDRDLESVKDKLTENDYATLLVTAEVLKNSFEFWAPTEIGGSGEGSRILSNFNLTKRAPPKGWRGVIYADGIGAAGAFIGNAFVMGAGPIGVGAYFGSVAIAAGFSSAMGSWK